MDTKTQVGTTNKEAIMDVVILAGGKPQNEKYWPKSKGLPKPMIDINGKPMVQWVIDAVNKSKTIENIYIVGLSNIDALSFEKPVTSLPDFGGIFKNLAAASNQITKEKPDTGYFLSISSDIPLIDTGLVDAVAGKMYEPGFDIFYNVIEKKTMERKFPGIKRTYIRFKDGNFCGGDMHVISTKASISPTMQSFEKFRKKPLKLISTIGFDMLFRMLFSPPSISEAAKIIYSRTGILGKAINCSFPEIGMDIDNPAHLALLGEILSKKLTG